MAPHKSDAEIVRAFYEQVNMAPDELEAWLDAPESARAGTGVGHDSGRRIVEILRRNPEREEGTYGEDDLAHMRKVAAYNTRHLAQEDHLKETKTVEELEKTKSTISLRNWGHDPVKVKKQQDGDDQGGRQGTGTKESAPESNGNTASCIKRKRGKSVSGEDSADEGGEEDLEKPAKRGRPTKRAPRKRGVSGRKSD